MGRGVMGLEGKQGVLTLFMEFLKDERSGRKVVKGEWREEGRCGMCGGGWEQKCRGGAGEREWVEEEGVVSCCLEYGQGEHRYKEEGRRGGGGGGEAKIGKEGMKRKLSQHKMYFHIKLGCMCMKVKEGKKDR